MVERPAGRSMLIHYSAEDRLRYVIATVAGLVLFLITGLVQAGLIGQMLDGIRNPDMTETAILYIGELAIPCAVAIWAFFRTAKAWRRAPTSR